MPTDATGDLQRLIDDYTKPHKQIRLLEAGCGSRSNVTFGADPYIVGIDISGKQLARNAGLNEQILADIQTYRLPEQSFDIIICWDVIEHLDNPRQALEHFFTACKPGGLIILAFPNFYSFKGIITKLTPYYVHVWYYKYLLGWKEAGTNDVGPFPTPFRLAITYPAIRRFATIHKYGIAHFALYESRSMQYVRERYGLLNVLIKAVSGVSRFLTAGKIDAMNSDCIMVLRAGLGNR